MTKQQARTNVHEDLVSSWMNMATTFWDNAAKVQDPGGVPPGNQGNEDAQKTKHNKAHKNFETWQTTCKNLTSFLKLMTRPENQESVTRGMALAVSGENPHQAGAVYQDRQG